MSENNKQSNDIVKEEVQQQQNQTTSNNDSLLAEEKQRQNFLGTPPSTTTAVQQPQQQNTSPTATITSTTTTTLQNSNNMLSGVSPAAIRISELVKAKLQRNKKAKEEAKKNSKFLSIEPEETKQLLLDTESEDSIIAEMTDYSGQDPKQRYRYMVYDISANSKDRSKRMIWLVGSQNSDILDAIIAKGKRQVEVTRHGSGKTGTRYTITSID